VTVSGRGSSAVSPSASFAKFNELEKHEFMMGKSRGQLAVTLDVLTDALVLVGQHGVYCQSARTPGKPAMDIQIITKSISDAKELIAGVMADLKLKGPGAARLLIELPVRGGDRGRRRRARRRGGHRRPADRSLTPVAAFPDPL